MNEEPTVPAPAPRDQSRAVLFAALLGDFGLHHFYLGQPVLGAAYLLFCWTGVPGVLASIEACRYGFMRPEEWADRYNGGVPGKPVTRWLPVLLLLLPAVMLAAIFGAIYAGYDF